MRVGVIADIHSNAQALVSTLGCLDTVEEIWCLGDIVGYGPEPAQCVDLIRLRKSECVIGNHDLCVLNDIDVSSFSPDAVKSCEWNRNRLSDDRLAYLRSLPVRIEPIPGVVLVHGSPRQDIWEYVLSSWQADEILTETQASIIFVGHSHVPLVFMKAGKASVEFIPLTDGQVLELGRNDIKYLVNPGSVGQPRDGDPRACYMIFNTDTYEIEFHRVEYPVEVTQKEIRLAGLPDTLADRLSIGY